MEIRPSHKECTCTNELFYFQGAPVSCAQQVKTSTSILKSMIKFCQSQERNKIYKKKKETNKIKFKTLKIKSMLVIKTIKSDKKELIHIEDLNSNEASKSDHSRRSSLLILDCEVVNIQIIQKCRRQTLLNVLKSCVLVNCGHSGTCYRVDKNILIAVIKSWDSFGSWLWGSWGWCWWGSGGYTWSRRCLNSSSGWKTGWCLATYSCSTLDVIPCLNMWWESHTSNCHWGSWNSYWPILGILWTLIDVSTNIVNSTEEQHGVTDANDQQYKLHPYIQMCCAMYVSFQRYCIDAKDDAACTPNEMHEDTPEEDGRDLIHCSPTDLHCGTAGTRLGTQAKTRYRDTSLHSDLQILCN